MVDRRHKNANWSLNEVGFGPQGNSYSASRTIHTALLMDIRDELQILNRLLNGQNFISIPRTLRAIQKNTTKPKRKKKVPHD